MGTKVCTRCLVEKPEVEFYVRKNTGKAAGACKRCFSVDAAERYQANIVYERRRSRGRHLLAKYGITIEAYDLLLAEQGGRCAVCGTYDNLGKAFCVDHDHSCCSGTYTCGQCLRGILCHRCNRFLGNVNDSVDLLRSAIDYLTS